MHEEQVSRRSFTALAGGVLAGAALAPLAFGQGGGAKPMYKISLAQWSLHRALFAGEFTNLEFPSVTRERFGIEAVEFVNQFFRDKVRQHGYVADLKKRADDAGVRCLLIMCDGEGRLGDPDPTERGRAIDNHVKWLETARALGCHAIRVNAASEGSFEEQQKLAADGLARLSELAGPFGLSVLVENHGGYSSHAGWLAGVMRMVDDPRCGTLPDFGNFVIDGSRPDDPEARYDRYKGVRELMPFAGAVSAKSYDFDDSGEETTIDYTRMMKIVTHAGYGGHVGIEYEGRRLGEDEGIRATKRLLERVRERLG